MEHCYNVGESQNAMIENIVCTNSSGIVNTTITDSYYDKLKSIDVGAFAEGAIGLDTSEMKSVEEFVTQLNENVDKNPGWKHWTVGANGYPVFVDE